MSYHIFLEQEMGGLRPETVFESLAAFEKPVAAASLGQVYKAKLKSTGVSGYFLLYSFQSHILFVILMLLPIKVPLSPSQIFSCSLFISSLYIQWL